MHIDNTINTQTFFESGLHPVETTDSKVSNEKIARIRESYFYREFHGFDRTTPPLRKQRSLPNLSELLSEQSADDAIRQKDGYLWKCVARQPNEYHGERFAGYLYTYRWREEEYGKGIIFSNNSRNDEVSELFKNRLDELEDKLYPANEALPRNINIIEQMSFEDFRYLLLNRMFKGGYSREVIESVKYSSAREEQIMTNFLSSELIHDLGYSILQTDRGIFITMPDREALLARWALVQEKYQLPDIHVASSEGIADDLSFVLAHLYADFLISSGKEFVHDQHSHALIQMIFISTKPKIYRTSKLRLTQLIGTAYRKAIIYHSYAELDKGSEADLKAFEYVKTYLGICIDLATSKSEFKNLECAFTSLEGLINEGVVNTFLFENPSWKRFWESRYHIEAEKIMIEVERVFKEMNEAERRSSSKIVNVGWTDFS